MKIISFTGNDRTTIAIVVIVNLVVFTVLSIVGLIMAIILLKGTAQVWIQRKLKNFKKKQFNFQKRVSYLTAWIIYNAVSCVIHIISMITSHNDRGIQFLGINECLAIFGIFFVYAHIKDIKRGVFGRV